MHMVSHGGRRSLYDLLLYDILCERNLAGAAGQSPVVIRTGRSCDMRRHLVTGDKRSLTCSVFELFRAFYIQYIFSLTYHSNGKFVLEAISRYVERLTLPAGRS